MNKRSKQIVAAVLVAVSTGGTALLIAQQMPTDAPPAVTADATVKGVVQGMNLNADGEPNGLLIKTGDGPLSQVNFPPHMAAAIAKVVKPGTTVTANTRPLPPKPPRPANRDDNDDDRPAPPPAPPADHPVAELVSLTPDGGEALTVVRPDAMPTKKVEGTVARLNYTRDGQADGAVLDDGTLVHTGPKEAADLELAVGQKLTVEGTHPGRAADNVIHATNINGTAIDRPAPKPGPGPKGPKGPPTP